MTACMAALSCMVSATGNQCGTCGGAGQSCCGTGNNGTCTMGLACTGRMNGMGIPGMCATCGGTGQPCCPTMGGAAACQTGLACSAMICALNPMLDGGPADAAVGQ